MHGHLILSLIDTLSDREYLFLQRNRLLHKHPIFRLRKRKKLDHNYIYLVSKVILIINSNHILTFAIVFVNYLALHVTSLQQYLAA